ncbi:MAG: hypothetical protein ACI3ZV_01735 [Paludibacteraceae bacterium]
MTLFQKIFSADVDTAAQNGESVLGNLGSITVEIDLPVKSAALLSVAIVIPILVYFICKKLI